MTYNLAENEQRLQLTEGTTLLDQGLKSGIREVAHDDLGGERRFAVADEGRQVLVVRGEATESPHFVLV